MKNDTLIVAMCIGFLVFILIFVIAFSAVAEKTEAYVLCNPKSTVNVHDAPGKGASVIAYAECGDDLILDGQSKGEWVHIVNSWVDGNGWIHRGYVSDSPVQIETYQAYGYLKVRIRNRIQGNLKGTLKKGEVVTVYASATGPEGWAFTSRGYIQAKYLDDGLGGI